MESCLEFGLTGFITIIVTKREKVEVVTIADKFAYLLAYVALFNLICAPIDLLRATYQIHLVN